MTARNRIPFSSSVIVALVLRISAGLALVFRCECASAKDMFRDGIAPFVKKYCSECHNASTKEADLNLMRFESPSAIADEFRQWGHVMTFVKREEMPPKSETQQPTDEERRAFLNDIRSVLDTEGKKVAGDPGVVLPRRLSNAEYDYSVRDLTGVDIKPTRTFPVDPAAGEGFDNTGEALTMSPGLFAKLYSAAQYVSEHALLTADGIRFAPYPVENFADRAKYCEQAILRFYEQHAVDYEKYLIACWELRHRSNSQKTMTVAELAQAKGLSPKYLATLYDVLQGESVSDQFYQGWLRDRWNEIPGPKADGQSNTLPAVTRSEIQRLARDIASLSRQLCPRETEAILSNAGNAPVFHLERRRKTASERDSFDQKSLQASKLLHVELKSLNQSKTIRISIAVSNSMKSGVEKGLSSDGYVILKSPSFSAQSPDKFRADDKQNLSLRQMLTDHAPAELDRLKFGVHPLGDTVDAESLVISTTSPFEVEIPSVAFGEMRDVRFYVDAQLDRSRTLSGVLRLAWNASTKNADGKELSSTSAGTPILLVDPNHSVKEGLTNSGTMFCRVFPNRFFFVDETRGLSAGFHLIEGFFRDDQPLCKLVLSDDENRELLRLWNELEFITGITERMLRGFVFFERSERNFLKHADFDSFKEEDPKLVEIETLNRFERVYLDRSNVKQPIEELASHPIHVFFEDIRNGLRRRDEQLRAAEPLYLRDLEKLARLAYRRPLTRSELDDLKGFYRDVAGQKDLGLEQAVRASLVRILMSPYFTCRIVPSPEGETVKPMSDLDFASRLSFFLWASGPDEELLELASAGKLQDEKTLISQVRRMLKNEKVRDFSREFFGQWLGYRDFSQRESVDRVLFREFDEPLKQAMFEEPTRLAEHLIRNDLPVTQLLNSDATFVNGRLSRHYGFSVPSEAEEWSRVEGLSVQGRSGLLGMAVFLTANSQPQRTSPVKRGFWVVHKILGEHIPAPPADVVALPAKETDTNGKTIRQLLAQHVEDAKCARCHVRFDAVGLSMEGFDPIGKRRTKDLAGRAVDDVVRLGDGTDVRGVPEFASQLVRNRRDDYVQTLCRKLLGYALGRSLQLSDEVLLKEMRNALDKNGDRFVPLFETVVLSPQFRNQRCRDFSLDRYRKQLAR